MHSKMLNVYLVIAFMFVSQAVTSLSKASELTTRPATFADVVEASMPAVVNISTTQSIDVKNPLDDIRNEIPEGSPFEHFFKEFMEREFNMPEMRKRKATSLGSGFVIDQDGFIVTNHHVIDGADEITVTLSTDPDTNYYAKVVGADEKTDLAVLKIDAGKPLNYLTFGDSDKARVGDWVLAIGNPFGLGGTVTAGIVSAKSRFLNGRYDELIQTDASINRGNSGGPMLNVEGKVIGINSVLISNSGGNIGIGFSIPSNQASKVVQQLKGKGKIVRGWIGVALQELTEDIAKNIDVPKGTKGVLIAQVLPQGPAEKGGIKPGDVIVKFDGLPTPNIQKLMRVVAETQVGKKCSVELFRDGKSMQISLTVALREDKTDEKSGKESMKESVNTDMKLGIKMEDINPALRTKFKIDQNVKGVIIVGTSRNSVAADAGILPGDILLQVNRTRVHTVQEVVKCIEQVRKSGSKDIAFLISRNGANRFVVLDLQ